MTYTRYALLLLLSLSCTKVTAPINVEDLASANTEKQPRWASCAPITVENNFNAQHNIFAANAVPCTSNTPVRITEAMCREGVQTFTNVDARQAGLLDFIEIKIHYGTQTDLFAYTQNALTNAWSRLDNGSYCTARMGVVFTCKMYVEGTKREWCLQKWP